jgi:hypothetical protein
MNKMVQLVGLSCTRPPNFIALSHSARAVSFLIGCSLPSYGCRSTPFRRRQPAGGPVSLLSNLSLQTPRYQRTQAMGWPKPRQKGIWQQLKRRTTLETEPPAQQAEIAANRAPEAIQRCNYRKLKHPQDTRLLVILPGEGSDELRCVVRHIRLQNKFLRKIPEYLALSYTWGSPDDTAIIRCDDGYLRIPSNLYHALLRLRLPAPHYRKVWADAICINQGDIQERVQQVQIMRQIFAHATLVTIWLDDHDETSRDCCELIDTLIEYYGSDDFDLNNGANNHPDLEEDQWTLYKQFFQRPWFSRVWVFQEAVVAHLLTFVWGDWEANWQKIMLVVQCVGTFGNPVIYDPVALQNLWHMTLMDMQRVAYSEHYNRDKDSYSTQLSALIYLVDHARERKATDPRDRIFALQGLAQERDKPEFVVDYSLSVEQVYRNFALYELFQRRDLNILSSASQTNLNLPSWIPDWTFCPKEGFPLASSSALEIWLEAGGNPASYEPVLRFSDDSKVLYVKGTIFTKPQVIGMPNPSMQESPPCHDDEHVQKVHNLKASFLQDTYRITSMAPDPHPDGQPRIEAYLRALTFDYFERYRRFLDAIPVTFSDGLKVLTKYGVLHFESCTEFEVGWARVESHIEWKTRRFCLTENGYIGWVPQDIQMTDLIAMFVSGRVLYVLRPVDNGHYKLTGVIRTHP